MNRPTIKLSYPKCPALSEGYSSYRIFTVARVNGIYERTKVIYEGKDQDVVRLLINSSRTNLVPPGETMETMP